jgi:DNA-binding transcriptional LysR family regulator
LGWLHYILYASPGYLSIHGVPETMFDLGRHRFLMHTGYNKQKELWHAKTPAWIEILSRALQSNSSTVLLESCACDGGILPMPTYVSEFEHRVQPLTHIRPLASARLWLAYSERLRGHPQYEPVLAWIRDSYDPGAYQCFRETYVPPALPPSVAA